MIILNLVLPQFDTRQNMMLKIAVSKPYLSERERAQVVTTAAGNGNINIGFKTTEAISASSAFDFTTEKTRLHEKPH